MDADATAEQIDRLRAYLSKKFHHSDDVQLLMSPTEVLSKLFVSDLAALATTGPVTLYFDTFERTGPFLERWLLDLLGNRYGSLPADLVITIAGQRPLYQTALGEAAEAERVLLDCLAGNPNTGLITEFLNDLADLPSLPGLDRQAIDALAELASAELERRASSSHE